VLHFVRAAADSIADISSLPLYYKKLIVDVPSETLLYFPPAA
jgi:hypothetical protein